MRKDLTSKLSLLVHQRQHCECLKAQKMHSQQCTPTLRMHLSYPGHVFLWTENRVCMLTLLNTEYGVMSQLFSRWDSVSAFYLSFIDCDHGFPFIYNHFSTFTFFFCWYNPGMGGVSHWLGICICACLMRCFFCKFWYIDRGFSSQTKALSLHKFGVFRANYHKKHQIWANLGVFCTKLVYWWVVNGDKNRYSESQNFEVRHAHPRTNIFEDPQYNIHVPALTDYVPIINFQLNEAVFI